MSTFGKLNGIVYAVAKSDDGLVYAGGSFSIGTNADGTTTTGLNNIAKWDGSTWSALGGGLDNDCRAIAIFESDVYAGGNFTTAGGNLANRIAKWDGFGFTWNALGDGLNNDCYAIAIFGSDVYAGGNFTTAGGNPANRIAKWDGFGFTWNALGDGLNNDCYAIAIFGSDVYAGGNFTTAGGNPANRIAKWDGFGWNALGDGLNNDCYAIAITNSGFDVYAGGNFTTAGGNSASRIARWDGFGWNALGDGLNNDCYAIAITNSGFDVYAGGNFTSAGGNSASRIARWGGFTWNALGDGLKNTCWTLYYPPDTQKLLVGGEFTSADGVTDRQYIAEWDTINNTWSAQLQCLTEDTEVLTPNGYVNVTQLKEGDYCITSDGRKSKIVRVETSAFYDNEQVYPYIIRKNSIAENYPPKDFMISGGHRIKYGNTWILPMRSNFEQDKNRQMVRYYHLELENYLTDHLVINGGIIVESLANNTINKDRDIIEGSRRAV